MNNEELLNALGNLLLNRNKSISLDFAFENFITYSKSKCRPETIVYYNKKWKVLKQILNNFNCYNTSDVTKVIYNQLINYLIRCNYCNCTINKYCDVLKSILKVNVDLEYISYSPLTNLKKLKETIPVVKTITQENINKIFDYLFSLKQDFINIRDTTVILLMNDTGVRINELVNIKVKNIDLDSNTIYLDFTKTHDTRFVFIQDITKAYLINYLKFHNNSEYLFINLSGQQMKRDSIYNRLEKIKNKLNIEQSITPHKWRHTFATKLINNNVNLNTIMTVLGHKEYSTTKRYLHQENEQMKIQILNAIKN